MADAAEEEPCWGCELVAEDLEMSVSILFCIEGCSRANGSSGFGCTEAGVSFGWREEGVE